MRNLVGPIPAAPCAPPVMAPKATGRPKRWPDAEGRDGGKENKSAKGAHGTKNASEAKQSATGALHEKEYGEKNNATSGREAA